MGDTCKDNEEEKEISIGDPVLVSKDWKNDSSDVVSLDIPSSVSINKSNIYESEGQREAKTDTVICLVDNVEDAFDPKLASLDTCKDNEEEKEISIGDTVLVSKDWKNDSSDVVSSDIPSSVSI